QATTLLLHDISLAAQGQQAALQEAVVAKWRWARQDHTFTSGGRIPATGIYRVQHAEHRLPAEVTLLEGQSFPVCSRCNCEVHFELLRSAPLAESGMGVRLHSLPDFGE